jgi:curli production assembly/transport component CsgG
MWKLLPVILLAGCAASGNLPERFDNAPAVQTNPMVAELHDVPTLDAPKMTIGVYSFTDRTGQRAPSDTGASLSSAVTQGAEVWVIDALMELGNGTWFDVLERSGMDNLIKERQLIRSTRENYDENAPGLEPMKFAGIILEGGIVGYDSNTTTGGVGARYFGIGTTEQYRVDTVTVAIRLVSVSSGRVLMSVAAEKSIASYATGSDVFKFLDLGTKALELENGYTINEPTNYAVRAAIEAAVIEMAYEGVRKGLWNFK